jgi:hypothetical protein
MYKALGSIPSTTKTRQGRRKKEVRHYLEIKKRKKSNHNENFKGLNLETKLINF